MANRPVDEKIVQLTLENSDFEQKAAQSLNTFKQLNTDMSDVSNVNLSPLVDGVESLNDKFTLTGTIVRKVYDNIANMVVSKGGALLKKMTIGGAMDGWDEYNEKINNISVIMANTGKTGAKGEAEVGAALDRLNKYADRTVYSFRDMTKNIGLFTAAGVGLEDSITAIKGLSNLSAQLGVSNAASARATYQLSQALGAGKLNLQDWRSVENAGMGGKTFTKALWETGKEMGKVNIGFDQLKKKGMAFRETINSGKYKGWLTTDVLQTTLKKFATDKEALDKATKAYKESDVYKRKTAGEHLTDIEEKQLKNLKHTYEETKKYYNKYGKTASEAATEFRTLGQLKDAFFEGLGSTWSSIWGHIFGGMTEAKELWTGVGKRIVDPINDVADAVDSIFKQWHDLGGRTELIAGITRLWDGFVALLKPIGTFFSTLFPVSLDSAARGLYSFTVGFHSFADGLANTLEPIGKLLEGLAKVIATPLHLALTVVGKVITTLIGIVGAILRPLTSIVGIIGNIIRILGEFAGKVIDSIFGTAISKAIGGFKAGFNGILGAVQKVSDAVTWLFDCIKKAFDGFHIGDSFDSLKKSFDGFFDTLDPKAKFSGLFNNGILADIKNFFSGTKKESKTASTEIANDSNKTATTISDNADKTGKTVGDAAKGSQKTVANVGTRIANGAKKVINGIGKVFTTAWSGITNFFTTGIPKIWKNIQNGFTTVKSNVRSFILEMGKSYPVLRPVISVLKTIKNGANAIGNAIKPLKDAVGSEIVSRWKSLKTNVKTIIDTVKKAPNLSKAFENLGKKFPGVQKQLNSASKLVKGFSKEFDGLKNSAKKYIDDVKHRLGMVQPIMEKSHDFKLIVSSWFYAITGVRSFGDAFEKAMRGLGKTLSSFGDHIKTFAKEVLPEDVYKSVSNFIKSIKNAITSSKIYEFLKKNLDFDKLVASIKAIDFKKIFKGFLDFDWGGLLKKLLSLDFKGAFQQIMNTGFGDFIQKIAKGIHDLYEAIQSTPIGTALDKITDAIKRFTDSIKAGEGPINAFKALFSSDKKSSDPLLAGVKKTKSSGSDSGGIMSTFLSFFTGDDKKKNTKDKKDKKDSKDAEEGAKGFLDTIKEFATSDGVKTFGKGLAAMGAVGVLIKFFKSLDSVGVFGSITSVGKGLQSLGSGIKTLGVAVSLFAGAEIIKQVTPLLEVVKDFAKMSDSELKQAAKVAAGLLIFVIGIQLSAKLIKGARGGLLSLAIYLAGISAVIKAFKEVCDIGKGLTDDDFATIAGALIGGIFMIAILSKLSDTINPGMAVAFIGLAVAAAILGAALAALSDLEKEKATQGAIALFDALALLVGSMIAFSYLVKKGLVDIGAGAAFLGLAVALLVLAYSFEKFVVIAMTVQKLGAVALGAIFVMAAFAAGLVFFVSKIDTKNTAGSALAMIALSAAMFVLAKAIWEFMSIAAYLVAWAKASGDPWGLLIGVGIAIAAIIGLMFALAKAVSIINVGQIAGVAVAMLSIVAAITLLLVPILVISALWPLMIPGIAVVAGFILLLSLFAVATKDAKMGSTTLAFLGLAASFGILAAALVILADVPWQTIASGLIGFAFIILAFAAVAKAIEGIGDGAGVAFAMLGLGAAFGIMSIGLMLMASVPWQTIAAGLLGFAVVLVAFAYAANLVKDDIETLRSFAIDIVILSAAIAIMSIGISQLAGVSWATVAASLLGFAVVLVAFAAATKLVDGGQLLKLALGMAALSVEFVIFAYGISMIANANPASVITALIGFAGVAIVMSLVGSGLTAGAIGMLTFAAAAFAIGYAINAVVGLLQLFGVGAAQTSTSMTSFGKTSSSVGSVFSVFGSIVSGVISILVNIFSAFASVLSAVGSVISGVMDFISNSILGSLGKWVSGAIEKGGQFVQTLKDKFSTARQNAVTETSETTAQVDQKLGELPAKATEKMETLRASVADKFKSTKQAATEESKEMSDNVSKNMEDMSKDGGSSADNLMTNIMSAFSSGGGKASKEVKGTTDDILKQFSNLSKGGKSSGTDLMNGIISGLSTGGDKAKGKAKGTTDDILKQFSKLSKGGKSSSTDLMNGVLSGLSSGGSKAKGKAKSTTDDILKQFTNMAKNGGKSGSDLMTNIANMISTNSEKPKKEAKKAAEGAKKEVKDEWTGLNLGKLLTDGCIRGLNSEKVKKYARDLAAKALEAMKKKLDVNSPSKATMRIFQSVGEGAVLGMDKTANDVAKSGRELAAKTLEAIDDAMNEQDDLRYEPIIAPILDLDEMQSIRDTIASIPVRTGFRGIQNGSTSNKTNIKGINVQVNIRSTDGKSAQDIANIARKQAEEVITKEVRKINWR